MADARATVLPWPLDPDRVARASFSHSFRGFDPGEVRSFLARLAGELAALRARESELTARISELEHRRPVSAGHLDTQQVTELLGAEAARVLDAAREAAGAIRANAERHAGEVLEEARAEADELRARAETFLAERTAAAEAEAARIVDAAEAEGERLAQEARSVEEEARRDAGARLDAAREDGRRMVAEARAVRERILSDMARRRNHARQQLEKLRAGRERLLEAVEGVRRAAEEVGGELNGSLVEARLAGERAARQVDVDSIPPPNELDAEVELAKDAGLVDLAAIEREVQAGSGADGGLGPDLVGMPEPEGNEAVEGHVAGGGAGPFDIELDDVVLEEGGQDAPGTAGEGGAGTGGGSGESPVSADDETSTVEAAAAAPGEEAAPDGSGASPVETTSAGANSSGQLAADPAAGASSGEAAAGADPRPEPVAADPLETDAVESNPALMADPPAVGDEPAADRSTDAQPGDERPAGEADTPPTADSETGETAADPPTPAATGSRRKAPGTRPVGTRGAKAAPSRSTPATPRRPRASAARPAGFGDALDDVFSRIKHAPDPEDAGGETVVGPASAAAEGAGEEEPAPTAVPPATQPGRTTTAKVKATAGAGGAAAAGGAAGADATAKERRPTPADRPGPARAALHARDAVLAGTSRDLVRQLKLALSDEQNLVLELCRGAGGGRLSADKLPSGPAAADRYRTVIRRELATALAAGWRSALGEPTAERGAGPDGEPPVDEADLDGVVEELITALTEPLRQRLADIAGGDNDQPADQVRNLYRETRNDRVGALAEHAALAAYSTGQLAGLRRIAAAGPSSDRGGETVAVRWVFDACSPDCLDNSLVEAVPVGQPFPTGHVRPPAFPGCRCLLAPAADPSPRGRVATTAV